MIAFRTFVKARLLSHFTNYSLVEKLYVVDFKQFGHMNSVIQYALCQQIPCINSVTA